MLLVALILSALPGVRGNLDITEEAVYRAVSPVADSMARRGVVDVVVSLEGTHEGSWLVQQTVTDLLSSRGIRVHGQRSESPVPVLTVRPMQLGVVYGGFQRSWFLGGRSLQRSAVCSLAFTLTDGTGQVQATWRSDGHVDDNVPPSEASRFEHRTETWVNDTMPSGTGNKVLEPLVVTGVVAALIYLFYSSRAD